MLLVGGWWGWNATHPPLSDEEQIAADLEGLRLAVEKRRANQVLRYLADEFTWNGQKKSEMSSQIRATFFEWRDVQPNITGLQITADGDRATASGKYSIALRLSSRARPEVYLGEFHLQLEKRDGTWLITDAQHDFEQ